MGRQTNDGTVLNNSGGREKSLDLSCPQKAIVRDIYYIDDERNRGGDTVRAVVEVMTDRGYFRMPPVRIAYRKFGIENCEEINPRPSRAKYDGGTFVKDTTSDESGKLKEARTPPDYTDGDIVIVQFINRNKYDGYITGFISHGQEVSSQIAAKKEDGDRYLLQHQGLRVKIDKNGNYLLETFESKLPEFKSSGNPKRTISFKNYDKKGNGQEISLDNANNVSIVRKNGANVSVILMNDQKINMSAKATSMELKNDGHATLTVDGEAMATFDKSGKEIKLSENGGSELIMKDGKIKFGSTEEAVALLIEICDVLSQTVASGFGAPISSVAQFAALKTRIEGIKL